MAVASRFSTQSGAMVAFTCLGVCILLPYNCFLQAQPYFSRYLFAGRGFPFTSMLCFSLPQSVSATVFMSRGRVFTVGSRMFVSFLLYAFFCATFAAIPRLAELLPLDAVYFLTLFSIVVSAVGNSLMQTSLLGFTATLGEKLSKAAMSGLGVSGLISFVFAVMCDTLLTHQGFVGEAKQQGILSIMFVGCGAFVLFAIWIFHCYLCQRHQKVKAALQRLEGRRHSKLLGIEFDPNCDLEALLATPPPSPPSFLAIGSAAASPDSYLGAGNMAPLSNSSETSDDIIADAWTQRELRIHAFNVWLTFAVTLSVFPGVMTQWIPRPGSVFEHSPDRFILLLIGTFQVFDVVGRYMADWFTNWIPSDKLVFYAVLRVLFIPVFILGQRRPTWSLIWGSDLGRILLVAFLAGSNGLLGTCAMMFGPSSSPEEQKEVAGSVMSTSLYVGLFSGTLGALVTQL